MLKLLIQSIRQTIVWSVITGIIYPLVFTVFAQFVFPKQANGSLVMRDGKLVGSEWMAQQFQGANYFWPRPSAASYGTGATGLSAGSGSNLGPTSAQLQTNVRANAKALRDASKLAADAPVPADLVYASASGVDPHISPEAAEFQVARVAAARGMSPDKVRSLVEEHVEQPQLGFLGQARVNVLLLNLALDAADTKKSG
jgi:potassium-transporting ATPase KdpC subunit